MNDEQRINMLGTLVLSVIREAQATPHITQGASIKASAERILATEPRIKLTVIAELVQ